MSQRNRLGLTDLAGLRKPLLQTGGLEKGSDGEAPGVPQTIPAAVPPEVPLNVMKVTTTVPSEVPPSVPPRILQQRKDRKRLVSQSFKLPVELDELWSRVAAFNKVTKTGILLEALETFLQRLPQPPGGSST
jgi:hypothetical protein